MKTTLDLDDTLLIEAKTVAARRRTTLKALVEHALQREIRPSAAETTHSPEDAMIEIGPHGLPRLRRANPTGTLTTERVRQLMDEEGV
jgi:hypothetical protein